MQTNMNGWHCLIFTVMGSTGHSMDDLKDHEEILDFLINKKSADSHKMDNSSKDALYYAHKIYPMGGPIVELLMRKK